MINCGNRSDCRPLESTSSAVVLGQSPAQVEPTDQRPLSMFQVMPREMYFGRSKATSIDLSVRDLVASSRFRGSTTIFAEAVDDCFEGFSVRDLPSPRRRVTVARANCVASFARIHRPDLIFVQQHLPSAAAIAARLPGTSIVLHTHNFQKTYGGTTFLERVRRAFRKRRYTRLAGIIHVSEVCAAGFSQSWSDLRVPSCVVHNGLDFECWKPEPVRSEEVLYVGRCAPEKGTLEAAQAAATVLPQFSGWRARFILSAVDRHPDYFREVQRILAGLGERSIVDVQVPFEKVKEACERAAIAIVPSHCAEGFGRTALEAHAGGAAVISSGAGALAEVSGDCAMRLPAVTAETIASAIKTLIHRPDTRVRFAGAGAGRVRELFGIERQAARLDSFCLQLHSRRIQEPPASRFSTRET
jgi:glycosyltransferase involved in cell wall biosynthesis